MTERWEFGTVLEYSILTDGWRVMVLEDRGTEMSFICVTDGAGSLLGKPLWRRGKTCETWTFRGPNEIGVRSLREWWTPCG